MKVHIVYKSILSVRSVCTSTLLDSLRSHLSFLTSAAITPHIPLKTPIKIPTKIAPVGPNPVPRKAPRTAPIIAIFAAVLAVPTLLLF